MNPTAAQAQPKSNASPTTSLVIPLLVCALAFFTCSLHQSTLAQSRAPFPMQVTSESFSDGGAIPQQFTCDGADNSPGLRWTTVPGKTKSLALVMHDPDAPVDFTHWLAYNIPPSARELAAGASPRVAMPKGSDEGMNDFSHIGYGGPCPPPGKPHHYIFSIYALDAQLALPAGSKRGELEAAIKRHMIAMGRITGLYQR